MIRYNEGRIFESYGEWFNITLGLLFFAVCALFYLSQNTWSPANHSFIYLTAASIGSGHTLLSLWLLFSSAEIRQKLHFKITKDSRLFAAILILGFLIVIGLLNRNFSFVKSVFIVQWLEFILLVVIGQHALAQTKGLSLLYNRTLLKKVTNKKDKEKVQSLEYIEKKLFTVFIFLWLATLSVRKFELDTFIGALSVIVWVPAILILLLSAFYPFSNKVNKSLFLVRLLIYPISIEIPIASFFIFFLHGFEYQQVVFSVISKRQNEKLFIFALLVTTFIIFPFMNLANGTLLQGNSVLLCLFLVAQFINHIHYVCDALIFRKTTTLDLFSFQKAE